MTADDCATPNKPNAIRQGVFPSKSCALSLERILNCTGANFQPEITPLLSKSPIQAKAEETSTADKIINKSFFIVPILLPY